METGKNPNQIIHGSLRLTDQDIYLFKEGNHFRLYDKLGAHVTTLNGKKGTYFAVWAPNAHYVSVVGDFNGWNRGSHKLGVRWDSSGIWEGFIEGVKQGDHYKYYIESKSNGYKVEKRDPFAYYNELPPRTASTVWDLDYKWNDTQWMKTRAQRNSLKGPISVYELHLGSWRRKMEEGNRSLTYRELAKYLVDYIKEM